MSAGPGPLRVVTLDGAVWVQAAVTRAGLGLYCPEGVVSCPRFVMATLAELAEHGVKAAPPVTDLRSAVALMGALPMPVGEPLLVELTEQQLEALINAGNHALSDYYHERQCHCSEYPAGCVTNPGYRRDAGYWDTDAFAIGVQAVLGVWELLRNDRHASELEELRARVAELEAQAAELKADRADRHDDLAGALGHSPGTEWPDLISVAAAATASEARPVEDPHNSPLHHTYALGHDLPYFENPGVPTPEERGTYCPHGVLIAGPVSPNVFWVIDPWPCTQPGCTREKFERVQAEVAAELAKAETGGAQ